EVELNRPALPDAAQPVLQLELELGSVERAFARLIDHRHPELRCGSRERLLGDVPARVRSEPLGGTPREPDDELVEAEAAVEAAQRSAEAGQLPRHLLGPAEDVSVVLQELPQPE